MSDPCKQTEWDTTNQACYDHCSQYWDRFPFPDILPDWIRDAPFKEGHVLDIGSGTGRLALWLQQQGYSVDCLDPSPVMTEQCRAKGLSCKNIRFQDYDPAKSYAMAFAILSLIHLPKKEWPHQIEKTAKLLDSGGLFFLAVIEGKGEGIKETASPYPRYFSYFSRSEIESLTASHFELIRCATVPAPSGSYLLFLFRKQ